jgi:transposase-like protein
MAWSQQECIAYLEKIRWDGVPHCPYCGSRRSSPLEQGLRHHCNDCFTSYSVTVGTLFHNTHVPLWKWFLAISILLNSEKKISIRKLANQIGVSKKTASYIRSQVYESSELNRGFIQDILKGEMPEK